MGDHLQRRAALGVFLLGVVVLLTIPSATAVPLSAAGVPVDSTVLRAPSAHLVPATAAPTRQGLTPVNSASAFLTEHARGLAGPRIGAREFSTPPPTSTLAAKKSGTTYDWSSAYIFYGPPPPPADLQLGEGAGWVTDNARNESVMFGGLGQGGLSNVTWIYGYYYNASAPETSGEYGGYTNSTTWPSSRTNSSFGAYQAGGVALLFGGLTDLTSQATANDTWLYYFGNDTWVNITRPGGPFPGRRRPSPSTRPMGSPSSSAGSRPNTHRAVPPARSSGRILGSSILPPESGRRSSPRPLPATDSGHRWSGTRSPMSS